MTESKLSELYALEQRPYGRGRSLAAAQIVAKIEREGPEQEMPVALLRLVEAYQFSDQHKHAFVTFARLLRLWDTRPELFDAYDEQAMFWQYKWVAEAIPANPEVSLAQCEKFLDEMEQRFRVAAKGLKAPLMARFTFACDTGSDRVDEALNAWESAPSDDFDDCEACQVGTKVSYLCSKGQWRQAINVAATMRGSCNIEPAKTYHICFYAAAHLGDADLALKYYTKSITSMSAFVAGDGYRSIQPVMLEALALVGAEQTFRHYLRKENADYFMSLGDNLNHLFCARRILSALVQIDAGGSNANISTGLSEGAIATMGGLLNYLSDYVARVSAKFDARNGNSFYSDSYRAVLRKNQVRCRLDDSLLLKQLGVAVPDTGAPKAPTAVPGAKPAAAPGAVDSAATRTGGKQERILGDSDPEWQLLLQAAEKMSAEDSDDPQRISGAYCAAADLALAEGELAGAGVAFAESAQWAAIAAETVLANERFLKATSLLFAAEYRPDVQVRVLAAWDRVCVGEHAAALQGAQSRLLARVTETLKQYALFIDSGYNPTDILMIREAGRAQELLSAELDETVKPLSRAELAAYSTAYKQLTGEHWR